MYTSDGEMKHKQVVEVLTMQQTLNTEPACTLVKPGKLKEFFNLVEMIAFLVIQLCVQLQQHQQLRKPPG